MFRVPPSKSALKRTQRTKAARGILVACALACLLFGAAGASPSLRPAHAGWEWYCADLQRSPGSDCYGDRHSLRNNQVHNNSGAQLSVAASALTTSLAPYGSWFYGLQRSCHSYSGDNLLHPWYYNSASVTQTMSGLQYYGNEGPCPF